MPVVRPEGNHGPYKASKNVPGVGLMTYWLHKDQCNGCGKYAIWFKCFSATRTVNEHMCESCLRDELMANPFMRAIMSGGVKYGNPKRR